jgi:hypothetical protein
MNRLFMLKRWLQFDLVSNKKSRNRETVIIPDLTLAATHSTRMVFGFGGYGFDEATRMYLKLLL